MWFFDYISDGMEWIGDKLIEISESVDGVPIIGAFLAYPFLLMGVKFNTVSDSFTDASKWADEAVDAYNRLPEWGDIVQLLKDTFNVLNYTFEQIVQAVIDKIPPIPDLTEIIEDIKKELKEFITGLIPDWLPDSWEDLVERLDLLGWLYKQKSIFLKWVAEGFEEILDYLFSEEEEFIVQEVK